jgi:cell division septation protein DedD
LAKKNAPAIQISRKGMFVWIGLIVFVAGWMFVLGIMVGRGSAPVNIDVGKLEQELAALKKKMLAQEQAKVEAQVSGKEGGKPPLGFYEALKSPQKQEKPFQSLPAKPVQPKPAPVPEKPKVKIKPVAKPKPKPKPKPAIQTKPVRQPQPKIAAKPAAQTTAQKGRFAIQIAAVQDAQNAEKLVTRLRKKGYRAYQIRSEVTGKGVWHRVRVGAFQDRAEANRMLAKLKGDRFGGMVVSTR